jgi:hypothetical protein
MVKPVYLFVPIVIYYLLTIQNLIVHLTKTKILALQIMSFFNIENRFPGLTGNANESVLLFFVLIVVVNIIINFKYNNVLILLTIFFIPPLLASGSKKGIIFFVVTILYLIKKINKRTILISILLLFLFCNISVQLKDSFIYERFVNAIESKDNSTILREEFISNGIRDVCSNLYRFLFGYGAGNFENNYHYYSHNNLIEILYSYGFITTALYMLIMLFMLIKLFTIRKYKLAMLFIVVNLMGVGWIFLYDTYIIQYMLLMAYTPEFFNVEIKRRDLST